jgi:hypothetical protein
MVSPKFDFDEFVRAVENLDYQDVLAKILKERSEVVGQTAGHARGAPTARSAGAGDYKNLLGGLHFLLTENRKPSSLYPWDLTRMRPVLESLVNRGQLKSEVLSVLD